MGGTGRPLVSVVVPTYNRPGYLERAVESVADQTYDPVELVVVDDCSEDPVEEILDADCLEDFERVEVLRHDENRGGAAARNTGIEAAAGEYIALLDDDDYWHSEKLARQVDRLRTDDVGAVMTAGWSVDGEGNTVKRWVPPARRLSPPKSTKMLLCRNWIGTCSKFMVEADVVDRAGTFDTRFPSWQDQEWYVRLSRHCAIGGVDEPLTVHTRGSPRRLTDDVETLREETYPLFLQKFRPLAREYGRVFERKMWAWCSYRVGRRLVLADRVADGRAFLTRAVSLYPFEPRFYTYLLPSLGGPTTLDTARKTKRTVEQFR